MRVVATDSLLPRITAGTPAGVEGVARVTVEAETFIYWDHGAWPTTLLRLVNRHILVGSL